VEFFTLDQFAPIVVIKEKRMVSKNRKKLLKEKIEYIEMQIHYEEFHGFYILHKCSNCDNSCRSEKCVSCYRLELEKYKKQLKDESKRKS
jgi:hypothetical protein